MDKESLPRWGWLLIGLLIAAVSATLINVFVLFQFGLSEEYEVVTTIVAMSPVLIYVGIWYDEERQFYWEQSRLKIAGDVVFILTGAMIGSALALTLILDLGIPRLVKDIIGMGGGFLVAWLLFYFRNPDVYQFE